jgi:membrane protease YdiL (CAAX protease family)
LRLQPTTLIEANVTTKLLTALTWPWGFWTFFGSFVLSYVREKTGSIVAPALLHGLPQAIAVALLGG